jgi:hypothetical protein
VRNLDKGESLDINTVLTSRMLPSVLECIGKDAKGFYRSFRCKAIPGGVRVTCTHRYKITDVREVFLDPVTGLWR